MGYTKLFSSLVTSTIWSEDDATRIVWITMLAIADKNGEVQGSIPGIARIAGVHVDAARAAIAKFLSPDPDSRTKDDEGRRIEEIDGGWHLLNYGKYRQMASEADRLEKAAERQRRKRARDSRNVTHSNAPVTRSNDTVTPESLQKTQAEAEAEAEAEADTKAKTKTPLPPKGESASPWVVAFNLELPESLQTGECMEAVKLWLAYKKERKEAYKPIGLQAALTKWGNEFNAATFPQSIRHSIANQWKGIFAHGNPATIAIAPASVRTADNPPNGHHEPPRRQKPLWAQKRDLEDERQIILDRTPTSAAGRHYAPGDEARIKEIRTAIEILEQEEAKL